MNIPSTNFIIRTGSSALDLSDRCHLMGIVNCTPDSFSSMVRRFSTVDGVSLALQHIADGADILDIGGESTRPGARSVPLQEELDRVIPVIETIRRYSDIPISIDTRKAAVASAALHAGADIVNDISALRFDPAMTGVVASASAPLIVMHMLGTPETMQFDPLYADVVDDVASFFRERASYCTAHGIHNIIFDPGIGFGKTIRDNLKLLRAVPTFVNMGRPVLIGVSRKSFIGALTGRPVGERMAGTIAGNVLAFSAGAHILRVHDVKHTSDALRIAEAIMTDPDDTK